MSLTFLTPFAGLLALLTVVPLLVFVLRERRAARVRRSLALAQPTLRSHLPLAVSLAAIVVLLGLAAAQPVIETTRERPERTDAQIFLVLDTSRSMLASTGPRDATRFMRARTAARELRSAFAEVPVGLASFTDRVLPHVFPTTNRAVFSVTLERSMDIERPGPLLFAHTATNVGALAALATRGFYTPSVRKRVAVVFTDGETRDVPSTLARPFSRTPRVQTFFVHHWSESERIYATGAAEPGYKPNPAAERLLDRTASLIGGRTFTEGQLTEVHEAIRKYVGADGPKRERVHEGERFALMPFATLAAVVPLAVVLRRRNL